MKDFIKGLDDIEMMLFLITFSSFLGLVGIALYLILEIPFKFWFK